MWGGNSGAQRARGEENPPSVYRECDQQPCPHASVLPPQKIIATSSSDKTRTRPMTEGVEGALADDLTRPEASDLTVPDGREGGEVTQLVPGPGDTVRPDGRERADPAVPCQAPTPAAPLLDRAEPRGQLVPNFSREESCQRFSDLERGISELSFTSLSVATEEPISMQNQERLLEHISDLQTAVGEMKTAFTAALHQLAASQSAEPKSPKNDIQTSTNPGSALQVALGSLSEAVQQLRRDQQQGQLRLQQLMADQQLLLEELTRTGCLSEQFRRRLLVSGAGPPGRSSSGCHSTDSGLGAQGGEKSAGSLPGSDAESGSLPEMRHPVVSPMVHEYVNGLNRGDGYESDASLTLAINRSLTLSTSLSKQCGLQLSRLSGSGSESETQVRWDGESESAADESERLKVVQELAETERKYCRTLSTIQHTFSEPLAHSSLLTASQHSTLFPEEIGEMYEKHCRLLYTLEERLDNWHWRPHVGDVLYRFVSRGESDVLRLYTSYVNDFPEVLKTFYKLCRTSNEFTNFLKGRLQHPGCDGLDLGALLLAPVQRMPRYILLLKQILRHTRPGHPDLADVHAVLTSLRDFLARLNDSMEHSFQLVAVHLSARDTDNRMCRQWQKAGPSVSGWERSGQGGRQRRRSRSRSRPSGGDGVSVDRSGSSSSGQTLSSGGGDPEPWRRPCQHQQQQQQQQQQQFDCRSLPHIKHRRYRARLSAARSETSLRPACCGSVHELHEQPRPDVSALSEPSLCDSPSPARPCGTQVEGSRTLPLRAGRSPGKVVVRSSSPGQRRSESSETRQRSDRRRTALRTIKNMFSLKKRGSRSGVLNISSSSFDLGPTEGDHYTPIQDPAPSSSHRERPDDQHTHSSV